MSEFVSLEKLSLVDFDGKISCTLFTKSCNFKCPFCHNKDLALSKTNTFIPFEEILSFLKRRIGILEGVCITGGEPTLMHDLESKIIQIKNLGFKIKLDTNGYKPDLLKKLIGEGLIDYVAMDIKNSLNKYSITTGIDNIDTNKILESINILKTCGIEHEFRTTLVKEFHSIEDIEEIANLLEGENKYFLQKFVNSENCINQNLNSISLDVATEFKEILEKKISNVHLRGY